MRQRHVRSDGDLLHLRRRLRHMHRRQLGSLRARVPGLLELPARRGLLSRRPQRLWRRPLRAAGRDLLQLLFRLRRLRPRLRRRHVRDGRDLQHVLVGLRYVPTDVRQRRVRDGRDVQYVLIGLRHVLTNVRQWHVRDG